MFVYQQKQTQFGDVTKMSKTFPFSFLRAQKYKLAFEKRAH